jgi:hypothetical protein
MSEVSITSGLLYLRDAQETGASLKWAIRMFDWVFAKTGLSINDCPERAVRPNQSNPYPETADTDYDQPLFDTLTASNSLSVTGLWDLNQGFVMDDLSLDLEDRMNATMAWMS